MTLLLIVGSATVLNIGILLVGVIWLQRQMKRVAAECAQQRFAGRQKAAERT